MEYYLMHHGVKGQKWGVRKYQNEDGTLTEAGKKRYYVDEPSNGLTEKRVIGMRREYHDKQGALKKAAKAVLMGKRERRAYDEARALGTGRWESLKIASQHPGSTRIALGSSAIASGLSLGTLGLAQLGVPLLPTALVAAGAAAITPRVLSAISAANADKKERMAGVGRSYINAAFKASQAQSNN